MNVTVHVSAQSASTFSFLITSGCGQGGDVHRGSRLQDTVNKSRHVIPAPLIAGGDLTRAGWQVGVGS